MCLRGGGVPEQVDQAERMSGDKLRLWRRTRLVTSRYVDVSLIMTMSNVRPLPVEHVVHSLRIDMHMLLVPLSEDGRTGQPGAILGFRCLSRARESRRD